MHSSGAALTTIAQPDSKVFITSYSLGREHLQPLIKSPSCHKPHFCMCKMPPNCPFFCLFFLCGCSQSAKQYKVFTPVCSGHREKKKKKKGSASDGKLDLSSFPLPWSRREEKAQKKSPKGIQTGKIKLNISAPCSLIACSRLFQNLGQKFGFQHEYSARR